MEKLNEVDCVPWTVVSEERDDSITVEFPDQDEEIQEVPKPEKKKQREETSR